MRSDLCSPIGLQNRSIIDVNDESKFLTIYVVPLRIDCSPSPRARCFAPGQDERLVFQEVRDEDARGVRSERWGDELRGSMRQQVHGGAGKGTFLPSCLGGRPTATSSPGCGSLRSAHRWMPPPKTKSMSHTQQQRFWHTTQQRCAPTRLSSAMADKLIAIKSSSPHTNPLCWLLLRTPAPVFCHRHRSGWSSSGQRRTWRRSRGRRVGRRGGYLGYQGGRPPISAAFGRDV